MGWIECVHGGRGTNFCINCTSSPRFAPSFMQLRNDPKCTQTQWNTPKHEFTVQWGGWGALVSKNYNATSWHVLLHYLLQFTLFCIEFQAVTKWCQMHPNTMKRTKTWVYGPNGWIRCFVAKITRWLRATNLCINCTSSVCFATSFVQLRNDFKCTQILQNRPKH